MIQAGAGLFPPSELESCFVQLLPVPTPSEPDSVFLDQFSDSRQRRLQRSELAQSVRGRSAVDGHHFYGSEPRGLECGAQRANMGGLLALSSPYDLTRPVACRRQHRQRSEGYNWATGRPLGRTTNTVNADVETRAAHFCIDARLRREILASPPARQARASAKSTLLLIRGPASIGLRIPHGVFPRANVRDIPICGRKGGHCAGAVTILFASAGGAGSRVAAGGRRGEMGAGGRR
jgi:hypothetical protein